MIYRRFCTSSYIKPTVEALWLGRVAYGDALDIQKEKMSNILGAKLRPFNGPKPNVLLMLEHNPVYTVGIRSHWYSEAEEIRLRSLGADFYRTDRGGLITFHGPGQLVIYPILDLTDFHSPKSGHTGLGVRQYVNMIELTVISLLMDHFKINAGTSAYTGVWVGDPYGPEKKIAAIGLRVKQHITSHGLALNCDTDLNWFKQIVPCGIEGKEVTSISEQLGYTVSVKDAIKPYCKAFAKQFDCDVVFNNNIS